MIGPNYLSNGINILAEDDSVPIKFGPKGTDLPLGRIYVSHLYVPRCAVSGSRPSCTQRHYCWTSVTHSLGPNQADVLLILADELVRHRRTLCHVLFATTIYAGLPMKLMQCYPAPTNSGFSVCYVHLCGPWGMCVENVKCMHFYSRCLINVINCDHRDVCDGGA